MNKKVYYSLDYFKLLCAILIAFLHSFCRDFSIGFWVIRLFSVLGVPFFFIVSGFFLTKGLMTHKNTTEYFKKYFKRLLILYLSWTVITLPIEWMLINLSHGDFSLLVKIVYLFRVIFISGSLGIYWYLVSLLYGCVIVYVFVKKKWNPKFLYSFSILFLVFGIIYDSHQFDDFILFRLVHIIVGSERNVLMVGIFYIAVGYYFAQHERKLHFRLGFLLSCFLFFMVLRILEFTYTPLNSMQVPLSVLLFAIALSVDMSKYKKHSVMARKLSTAIYLEQFPFILLFDLYLKRGTLIDFPAMLAFCLLVFYLARKFLPDRIYSWFYGGAK